MIKYGMQNKCSAYLDAFERQAGKLVGDHSPLEIKNKAQSIFEMFAKYDKRATLQVDEFGFGHGMGVYACYCEKFSIYADALNKDSLCHKYKRDSIIQLAVMKSICVVIVLINVILQTMVEYFVQHVGYPSHSKMSMQIMKYVFVAQLLNTIISLLITEANFSFVPKSIPLFHNRFADFTQLWYQDRGFIVVCTGAIQAFMPWVTLLTTWAIDKLWQLIDSNGTILLCCRKNDAPLTTKCKTFQ